MNAYVKRVLEGETPTPDEWNEHLIAFHQHCENATAGPMSIMRSAEGESSYQILARRTRELAPDAGAVLDIGCGDGSLLRKIQRLYGAGVSLTGIDLSEDEIARAAPHLENATFLCADARTADLGEGRFDAIISHLVLSIATQPERILQKARRALRDNGVFLAMFEALPLHTTVAAIFGTATAALRERHSRFTPVIPQRAQLEDDEQLRATLHAAGFSQLAVESWTVSGRLRHSELWAFVRRVYPFGLLAPDLQDHVRRALGAVLSKIDEDQIELVFPLRLVVARA